MRLLLLRLRLLALLQRLLLAATTGDLQRVFAADLQAIDGLGQVGEFGQPVHARRIHAQLFV